MNDFDEDEIAEDGDEFSEDEVISEAEWREKYRPINEDFEAGNAKHEAIVSAKDPRFVWTEVMDWDRDRATLLPMFLPSGGDVLYWHVCEVPWSDTQGDDEGPDLYVIMDYGEEEDEDDED